MPIWKPTTRIKHKQGNVYSSRPLYPQDWNERSQKVKARNSGMCSTPGCSNRARDTNHIYRVATGHHRKINLEGVCRKCHKKKPHHKHLKD